MWLRQTLISLHALFIWINTLSVGSKKYFYHPQSTCHLRLSLKRSYPTRAVLHPLKPQKSLFNMITICAGKNRCFNSFRGLHMERWNMNNLKIVFSNDNDCCYDVELGLRFREDPLLLTRNTFWHCQNCDWNPPHPPHSTRHPGARHSETDLRKLEKSPLWR